MTAIARATGWMALDSRGVPTVAASIVLEDGKFGTALAPAGASTGRHEALELRDGGASWAGKGVNRALEHLNVVAGPAIVGAAADQPEQLDSILAEVATEHGAWGNVTVALTVAAALADARSHAQQPWQWFADRGSRHPPQIPLPMFNMLSGGAHAGRSVDIQDVLAVPVGARTFSEAIEMAAEVRRALATLAAQHSPALGALVADEGGVCAPPGLTNTDAIALVVEAISDVGLTTSVSLALDVAANQFHDAGRYHLQADDVVLTADRLADLLTSWTQRFGIISLEDPFGEDDWPAWQDHALSLGCAQIVGDDLIATDTGRLDRALASHCVNSVLIKVNQAGTLHKSLAVLQAAQANQATTIVSARSGDTEETWLSDLAVGTGAGQIKVGSLHRSERTAKWNRLLALEHQFGAELPYAGRSAFESLENRGLT